MSLKINKFTNLKFPGAPGVHQIEIDKTFSGRTCYDGKSPVFDFPLIVIAFTNRCGSNILADYLRLTGNFSGLHEQLNWVTVNNLNKKTPSETFPSYITNLVEMQKKDTLAFGVKASSDQLMMLLRWKIDKMFSSLHVIHIERSDMIAQAVSFSIANQTKKWASTQKSSSKTPKYDETDILHRLERAGNGNKSIRQICSIYDLSRHHLFYEDLVDNTVDELNKIHEWLNIRLINIDLRKAKFSKQSTDLNDQFIMKFRKSMFDKI